MIGLLFALAAVQAGPVAATPSPQASPPPRLRYLPNWAERLEGKGWPFLDIDAANSVVLFAKVDTAHASPDHLRVLVRHEFRSDQAEPDPAAMHYHSEIISQEVDCSSGRLRLLLDHRYRFQNLEGQQLIYRFTDSDWRQPEPGSFDEEVLQAACMRPGTTPAP